ncbi:MAG: Uma2 family endonuclease [Anaerolinea sp.]|nr:Uma2 family endonuclease [Anaerolinea sp.]
MATPVTSIEETEAALLAKDGPSYELVDGELRERNVSFQSSRIAGFVMTVLGSHVRANRLGSVTDSELGIRIFDDPMTTRKADVAFISAARAPRGDQGFLRVAPDLVVEVVSPGDKASEVRAKVDEWLHAGVRLVWVVYPEAREVHVYPAEGRASILSGDDQLTGGDVVPGFTCGVAAFFPE